MLSEIKHEAMLLSKLHHDRILSFRGVVNAAGTKNPKYILFELADDSLKGYFDKMTHLLTVKEVRRLGIHLLSALAYLASFRIVHRDLKPANVLVFVEDDGSIVFKVGDVGLAKFTSDRSSRRTRGGTLSNAGTPLYKAPEVEDGHYDAKVDVFSFGVMLLEAVATRAVPNTTFRKLTSLMQLHRMCAYACDWLTSTGHPAFSQLLRDCVAEDPADRPTAAVALARLRAADVGVEVWAAIGSVHAMLAVPMPTYCHAAAVLLNVPQAQLPVASAAVSVDDVCVDVTAASSGTDGKVLLAFSLCTGFVC